MAATHMIPARTRVVKDSRVSAGGLFDGVGQHGEAGRAF
jgi:hypothetical protein